MPGFCEAGFKLNMIRAKSVTLYLGVDRFEILVVCQGAFGWSSALALQSGRHKGCGFSR